MTPRQELLKMLLRVDELCAVPSSVQFHDTTLDSIIAKVMDDLRQTAEGAARYRAIKKYKMDLEHSSSTVWTRPDGTTYRDAVRVSAQDCGFTPADGLDEAVDVAKAFLKAREESKRART